MPDYSTVTKQDELFPLWKWDKELTPQDDLQRIKAMQFHIKDELLRACLGSYARLSTGESVKGFRAEKVSSGYALLVTLVRRALGYYRFPFNEDRMLCRAVHWAEQGDEIKALLSLLTEERLVTLTNELKQLYEHTQYQLQAKGLKTVRLTRKIRSSYEKPCSIYDKTDQIQLLTAAHAAAQYLGHDEIEIEMDALNSFGDDSGYGHFPICLTLDIPIENILYCSNLIARSVQPVSMPLHLSARRGDVEENEWVVINPSPTGIIKIPTSAIEVKAGDFVEMHSWIKRPETAEAFFKPYSPFYIRMPSNMRQDDPSSLYLGEHYHLSWRGRFKGAWHALCGRV